MATLSLLGYGLNQGIRLTKTVNGNMSTNVTNQQDGVSHSKTFSKITVQNVLSENDRNSINISNNSIASLNSVNTIVRKIKDFGMVGAVNNAGANSCNTTNSVSKSLLIRKRPMLNSKDHINENISPAIIAPKKQKQTKELQEQQEQTMSKAPKKKNNDNNLQRAKKVLGALSIAVNGSNPKPAGTPGRKGLPLPQAVARRNARERNRVKQVNNGFAALRDRIPEEVAEAFEAQGPARGNSAKKLSKVETLRMAVEYIRSLERLLGFDFSVEGREALGQQYCGSSGDDSYSIIKDEFDTLSPSMDENFDDSLSHYDMDDYFATSNGSKNNISQPELSDTSLNSTSPMDTLPNITTLHGLQYIRIPGTNTYQLLTPDIFVGTTHSPPNSSLDDEHFSALIDTNCQSPTVVGQISPIQATNTTSPNISTTTTTTTLTTKASERTTGTALNAPASPSTTTITSAVINSSTFENGEPVAVPLSRLTPVPQMLPTTSSPIAVAQSSSSSYQQQQQQQTTELSQGATLSPAVNEQSAQACATTVTSEVHRQFIAPTLPRLLPYLIKQEYGESLDFVSTAKSPNDLNAYQTTRAAGERHEHATLSMSPPLDRCNRLPSIAPHHTGAIELQSFYEQDDSGSFYDNNLSFKKDLDDVLLDASSATNNGLSDESMIETIDWWEAHTPQSDGGSAVML